jgi:hypothetical protein
LKEWKKILSGSRDTHTVNKSAFEEADYLHTTPNKIDVCMNDEKGPESISDSRPFILSN